MTCRCRFVTQRSLKKALLDYATTQALTDAVANLIDQTALDAALANYATTQALSDAVANLIDQTALDAALSEIREPVGTIKMWAGTSDPPGGKWMVCDGRTLDGVDYPDLYTVVGQAFSGYPAPGTTFPIPNLRQRFPLGVGGRFARGESGGEEKHTLTVDEMPSHTHDTSPGYIVARDVEDGTGNIVVGPAFSIGRITHTGGDAPHNNMPPYLAINFIIKVLP